MHQLVIIDDESIIRKGLSTTITWEKEGFKLVGTATDGETGLKLIQETKPHIVISDIKMPFVNGLEMSQQALAQFPDLKIILLSSYDEFEFAKKALEIKVFDYLLKPVNREKLLETVKQAARQYDAEVKIERQIRESKPLLKQRFLTNLLNGNFQTENEILEEARFLDCNPWLSQSSIIILLKIDDYFNEKLFPGFKEQEILKFFIMSICTETIPPTICEIVDLGGDEIAILISKNDTGESFILEEAVNLGEKIRQRIEAETKTTVSIGVGAVKTKTTLIHESFTEAKTVIKYRHIFGKNQVIAYQKAELTTNEAMINLTELTQDLGLRVKLGLTEEALQDLTQMEQRIFQANYISLSQIRLLGIETMMFVIKEIINVENEPGEFQTELFPVCTEIMQLDTIHEIFQALRQFITEVTKRINSKREPQNEELIHKATQYIEHNYQNEKLSLEEVARVVHITPVYLSMLFKKKLNINFSEYLISKRMNKAMELIRNSDLKSYEVAEAVGYSNPQYFAVCFKKYTGFSPTDFKKC